MRFEVVVVEGCGGKVFFFMVGVVVVIVSGGGGGIDSCSSCRLVFGYRYLFIDWNYLVSDIVDKRKSCM